MKKNANQNNSQNKFDSVSYNMKIQNAPKYAQRDNSIKILH